ncbi:MAG TPA: hypothetical protein VG826_36135 [Pirellulales bacterium]|nr:hypothetical protein [Pirellulales bacterium]
MPDLIPILTHLVAFCGGFVADLLRYHFITRQEKQDALTTLERQRAITSEDAKDNLTMAEQLLEMQHKYQKPLGEVMQVVKAVEAIKQNIANPNETVNTLVGTIVTLAHALLMICHEQATTLDLYGNATDPKVIVMYCYAIIRGKRLIVTIRASGIQSPPFCQAALAYFDRFSVQHTWETFDTYSMMPETNPSRDLLYKDLKDMVDFIVAWEKQPDTLLPPPADQASK